MAETVKMQKSRRAYKLSSSYLAASALRELNMLGRVASVSINFVFTLTARRSAALRPWDGRQSTHATDRSDMRMRNWRELAARLWAMTDCDCE